MSASMRTGTALRNGYAFTAWATRSCGSSRVDYQPFVIYCPFPMPARIAGHSLADKVTDIQRINTALMRIYLDTQYLSIAPPCGFRTTA
jgi:hypothetical protein